jgi:hypothetical protein
MPISEPFKEYVIWCMGDYEEDHEVSKLECGYLYLMSFSSSCDLCIGIA